MSDGHPDRDADNREKRYGPKPTPTDAVNHPAHYGGGDNPYEAIKIIEALQLDFCLGNAVKYISRAGKKAASPREDLEKAIWYLQRRLKQVTEAESPPKHLK